MEYISTCQSIPGAAVRLLKGDESRLEENIKENVLVFLFSNNIPPNILKDFRNREQEN